MERDPGFALSQGPGKVSVREGSPRPLLCLQWRFRSRVRPGSERRSANGDSGAVGERGDLEGRET